MTNSTAPTDLTQLRQLVEEQHSNSTFAAFCSVLLLLDRYEDTFESSGDERDLVLGLEDEKTEAFSDDEVREVWLDYLRESRGTFVTCDLLVKHWGDVLYGFTTYSVLQAPEFVEAVESAEEHYGRTDLLSSLRAYCAENPDSEDCEEVLEALDELANN